MEATNARPLRFSRGSITLRRGVTMAASRASTARFPTGTPAPPPPAAPPAPPAVPQPVGRLSFEDRFAGHNGQGYAITNEEPEVWAELLDGLPETASAAADGRLPFRRALSICSGGEVPLLTLLPRVEEVIAVDHNYG